jgi:hypothetical protein
MNRRLAVLAVTVALLAACASGGLTRTQRLYQSFGVPIEMSVAVYKETLTVAGEACRAGYVTPEQCQTILIAGRAAHDALETARGSLVVALEWPDIETEMLAADLARATSAMLKFAHEAMVLDGWRKKK